MSGPPSFAFCAWSRRAVHGRELIPENLQHVIHVAFDFQGESSQPRCQVPVAEEVSGHGLLWHEHLCCWAAWVTRQVPSGLRLAHRFPKSDDSSRDSRCSIQSCFREACEARGKYDEHDAVRSARRVRGSTSGRAEALVGTTCTQVDSPSPPCRGRAEASI